MTAPDPRAWCDQVDARTIAATDGPWTYGGQGWVFAPSPIPAHSIDDLLATVTDDETGAFIAHARTDLPAATDALRAVLDLHAPKPGWPQVCVECNRVALGASVHSTYPCPTVKAVQEALDASS